MASTVCIPDGFLLGELPEQRRADLLQRCLDELTPKFRNTPTLEVGISYHVAESKRRLALGVPLAKFPATLALVAEATRTLSSEDAGSDFQREGLNVICRMYGPGDRLGFHRDSVGLFGEEVFGAVLTDAGAKHGLTFRRRLGEERFEYVVPEFAGRIFASRGASRYLWSHGLPPRPDNSAIRISITWRWLRPAVVRWFRLPQPSRADWVTAFVASARRDGMAADDLIAFLSSESPWYLTKNDRLGPLLSGKELKSYAGFSAPTALPASDELRSDKHLEMRLRILRHWETFMVPLPAAMVKHGPNGEYFSQLPDDDIDDVDNDDAHGRSSATKRAWMDPKSAWRVAQRKLQRGAKPKKDATAGASPLVSGLAAVLDPRAEDALDMALEDVISADRAGRRRCNGSQGITSSLDFPLECDRNGRPEERRTWSRAEPRKDWDREGTRSGGCRAEWSRSSTGDVWDGDEGGNPDVQKARDLEAENASLKRQLADLQWAVERESQATRSSWSYDSRRERVHGGSRKSWRNAGSACLDERDCDSSSSATDDAWSEDAGPTRGGGSKWDAGERRSSGRSGGPSAGCRRRARTAQAYADPGLSGASHAGAGRRKRRRVSAPPGDLDFSNTEDVLARRARQA